MNWHEFKILKNGKSMPDGPPGTGTAEILKVENWNLFPFVFSAFCVF
jgi:hypothetical protein